MYVMALGRRSYTTELGRSAPRNFLFGKVASQIAGHDTSRPCKLLLSVLKSFRSLVDTFGELRFGLIVGLVSLTFVLHASKVPKLGKAWQTERLGWAYREVVALSFGTVLPW